MNLCFYVMEELEYRQISLQIESDYTRRRNSYGK